MSKDNPQKEQMNLEKEELKDAIWELHERAKKAENLSIMVSALSLLKGILELEATVFEDDI